MPKLKYAAELCSILRSTGTGEGKLDLLRELIVRNPMAEAEEGYELLERNPHRVTKDTLKKARQIIDTGGVDVVVVAEKIPLIEDQAKAFIAEQVRNASKQQIRAAAPKFDASGVWSPKLAEVQKGEDGLPLLASLGRPAAPALAEVPGDTKPETPEAKPENPGTTSATITGTKPEAKPDPSTPKK